MYFNIAKVLIVLAITNVNAAPVNDYQQPEATILKYNYEPNANQDGGYQFELETSDGQRRSEVATVKYVGEEKTPVLSVNGFYSYVGPDGFTYTVTYLADENGFQPYGEHLPGAENRQST